MKKLVALAVLSALSFPALADNSLSFLNPPSVSAVKDNNIVNSVLDGAAKTEKARAYARIAKITGEVPEYTIGKYLVDVPLAAALSVVLPDGWKAQIRADVAPPKTMTASVGEFWLDVIDRAAMDANLAVVLDTKKQIVKFGPAPNYVKIASKLPVVAETVIRSSGETLPVAESGLMFHAVVDRYGYVLDLAGSTAYSVTPIVIYGDSLIEDLRAVLAGLNAAGKFAVTVDSEAKVVKVRTASGSSSLQVKHTTTSAFETVTIKGEAHWKEGRSPGADPESSEVATQTVVNRNVLESIQIKPANRIEVLNAKANFVLAPDAPSVKNALAKWSAQNGYHLLWNAQQDFAVKDVFEYAGTFESLLQAVEAAADKTRTPLSIKIDGKNVTVNDKALPVGEPPIPVQAEAKQK